MSYQFTRYTFTGIAGTGVHYLVLYLWLTISTNAIAATALGAALGAAVNYVICSQWVFTGRESPGNLRFGKFLVVAILSVTISTVLMHALIEFFGVWPTQVLATLTSLFLGYLLNSVWTFRPAPRTH